MHTGNALSSPTTLWYINLFYSTNASPEPKPLYKY